jgi:hypothetical protein
MIKKNKVVCQHGYGRVTLPGPSWTAKALKTSFYDNIKSKNSSKVSKYLFSRLGGVKSFE